jgi:hypothetical protein
MTRYHIPFLFFLLLAIASVSWVDAHDEIETTVSDHSVTFVWRL